MIIKKIVHQHRRDFRAIFLCEHCDNEFESDGYDDKNFHEYVIPDMKCEKCGKKAGENYKPLTTRYAEHVTV